MKAVVTLDHTCKIICLIVPVDIGGARWTCDTVIGSHPLKP